MPGNSSCLVKTKSPVRAIGKKSSWVGEQHGPEAKQAIKSTGKRAVGKQNPSRGEVVEQSGQEHKFGSKKQ